MCAISVLRRLAVLGLVFVLTVGLGGCARQPSASDDGTTEPTDTVEPTSTPDDPPVVEFHYMPRGERLATTTGYAPLETDKYEHAMRGLLAGPTEDETAFGFHSEIPEGTGLLDVTVASLTGVATVDLSDSFDDGGGTLSMRMRLAQVVFTLTRFPEITGVLFSIDGSPVEVLGGEGIIIDEPQTRADYEDVLPAVFVETPVPGSRAFAGEPLKLAGTANVFEAVFQAEVRAADGSVLAKKTIMATSGTGTRGTFSAELPFAMGAAETELGSLVVYVSSPKDGSPVDVVTIPIYLEPVEL